MNKLSIFLKNQNKKSLSENFHKQTQNRKLNTSKILKYPESWIKIHFKTYPRLDKVKLKNLSELKTEYATLKIINWRYSVREFYQHSISLSELSVLLKGSAGINRIEKDDYSLSRRSYPSAGGRYPLEIYLLILDGKEIKKGLYHYNVKENVLELLLEKNLSSWLKESLGGEEWVLKSSAILIITTVLNRNTIKYGDRGYRYSLMEAGHIAQNICLLSLELKLGTCVLGGFMDKEFDKLLDIDKQKEFTLYLIAIGKPKNE